MERKACSSPGGRGEDGGSKKDFIEGEPCVWFWLRIRGQARTSWDVPWRSWELLSVAGTIGFGEELDRLECTQEVRVGHGGPLEIHEDKGIWLYLRDCEGPLKRLMEGMP